MNASAPPVVPVVPMLLDALVVLPDAPVELPELSVPVEPELVAPALEPAELVPVLLVALDDDPVSPLALDDDSEVEVEVEVAVDAAVDDDAGPPEEPVALTLALPDAPVVEDESLPPQPPSRPETTRATENTIDLERCMRAPPASD